MDWRAFLRGIRETMEYSLQSSNRDQLNDSVSSTAGSERSYQVERRIDLI